MLVLVAYPIEPTHQYYYRMDYEHMPLSEAGEYTAWMVSILDKFGRVEAQRTFEDKAHSWAWICAWDAIHWRG